MDGDRISDVSFQGSGCAISTASASILTDAVKGKTRAEAESLFQTFHDLVTGNKKHKPSQPPQLGKLAVFSGVSEFPARVKCASLAWHTLHNALQGSQEVVTTELEEPVPGEIR
jgi:nitrogen fixation NifU-like protein